MKLVFVVIDSCGIVVKLLWDYCENPVGLLWLLAAHASTTRGTTVAANRGASSESKRRRAALKILVYIYITDKKQNANAGGSCGARHLSFKDKDTFSRHGAWACGPDKPEG